MTDVRADMIRVLHQAYVDNGWVPPTLDGYADALIAAGYGKVDGDGLLKAMAEAWEKGYATTGKTLFKPPNPYEPSA